MSKSWMTCQFFAVDTLVPPNFRTSQGASLPAPAAGRDGKLSASNVCMVKFLVG
jgi:hypothetical protein